MGLATHLSQQQIQHRAFSHHGHFQATSRAASHKGDTAGAPRHQIPEATPLVTRAERVLGFLKVWPGWARNSVASKTYWDCDRLCLRRLFPIPSTNPLQPCLPAWKGWCTRKFPFARGQGEVQISMDYKEEEIHTEPNGNLGILSNSLTS